MKNWFSKSNKPSTNTARPTESISDDLMAQIAGGAGKGACHTARLTIGVDVTRSFQLQSMQLAAF